MKSRFPFLFMSAALVVLAMACGDDDGTPAGPQFAFGLDATVVAGDGNADWVSAMEFAPDGRLFYAEQFKGLVHIILTDGSLQTEPFATIEVANWLDLDWGLTGMALDPDFDSNHYVYVFYTAPVAETVGKPMLVRFTEVDGLATDETVLSDDFPETVANHQGYNTNGEIHFGPDGLLYLSVGDYDLFDPANGDPEQIISPGTPIGKMLRVDRDGLAAADNPFADDSGTDTRIYATGFREPFSFVFGPDGTLYGNDNTTVSCEELNIINAGDNYGWPEMGTFPFSDCGIAPGTQPIYHFAREGKTPEGFISFTEVSALNFLEGSVYAQLTDGMIVCESEKSVERVGDNDIVKPGVLRRLVFSAPDTVAADDVITRDCKGGAVAHNGEVYYANSNQIKKLIQTDETGQVTLPPADGGGGDGGDGGQLTPPPLGN